LNFSEGTNFVYDEVSDPSLIPFDQASTLYKYFLSNNIQLSNKINIENSIKLERSPYFKIFETQLDYPLNIQSNNIILGQNKRPDARISRNFYIELFRGGSPQIGQARYIEPFNVYTVNNY
jgi:hypothetical protein